MTTKDICPACGQSVPQVDLSEIDVEQAAEVTKISSRQIYRWKNGESRPRPDTLELLKEHDLI